MNIYIYIYIILVVDSVFGTGFHSASEVGCVLSLGILLYAKLSYINVNFVINIFKMKIV